MNEQTFISYRGEKLPVIYDNIDDKIQVYGYGEENYKYITKDEFSDMKNFKTDYILVKRSERDKKKVNNKLVLKSLKEIYDEFVRDAEELKKQTNGIVNMYITGTDAKTAVELAYYYLNRSSIVPEKITEREAIWLKEATQGPLIFGEEYEGEAHKYDINSSYPSIYSNNNFLVPIKPGEFKKITKNEFDALEHYQYGIYRARIEIPVESKKYYKLFKLNENNKYTGIDLAYARKLGLKIEIIDDGNDNFLYYHRNNCKTGHQCFKQFVDLLYPLRKNEIIGSRCKKLLNSLWGALCQVNAIKMTIDPNEEFELREDKEVISMTVLGNGKYQVEFAKKDKYFETNYARIKPFILAKGRVKIAEYIAPHIDNVFRCHTDSMTTNIELPIKTSTKLGDMKYEGYCNKCKIVNSVNVVGEFILK